jgi:hypothetical protein
LAEADQVEGYIYGLDCQDAKWMHLGPDEFVLSDAPLPAHVVPLAG